ncbi:DUF6508 domain-containing protein [Parafrankia sp. BMG5.11]|uniref:DUF6508 domain-containing protein n=1 Tax=Parafrankia sp. BMG5.11 TaxID=222540 RepID=UPI00103C7F01|nr:DUF6508 domain-containing protein [Parafrankia sp. BMG5.11]TCJ41291.1 hypothetical protein E0504_01375 [Parafrankia sp. BMG5.11]
MVEIDASDLLPHAILELEAFARGDLPISHYVKDVPSVRLADKSWQVGYPNYQAGMDRLWVALNHAGLSTVTRTAYEAWTARDKDSPTLQEVGDLSREELLFGLFSIKRAERFSEGYWTVVLERGLFLAYAQRLAKINDR